MKKWILFSILIALLSCSNDGPILSSRPRGVLNKSEMTNMLVDINLAESALRAGNIQHTLPADSSYQKAQFAAVFKKNGVKPDDFNRSLTYYIEHIDELNDIYTEVINRLTIMDAEIQKAETKKDVESKKYILGTKKKNPQ